DETFTVPLEASDDPAAIGPVDLVVVSLKTTANPAVARGIGPLLHDRTAVAFAQNGVFWFYGAGFDPGVPFATGRLDPEGRLAAAVPPERAMGLIIYSPNEVTEPGRVVCSTGRSYFQLGAATAGNRQVDAMAAALGGAGLDVRTPPDFRAAMWAKLLVNLSSAPMSALTGSDAAGLILEPGLKEVCRQMVLDAAAVAAAHGFDDLGIDPEALVAPASRGPFKPSMLQDLERGRPMEVDSMLAIVQDFARAAGVATPTLDTVLALLTLLARSRGLYPAG
ncbi:MAG: ketopantoate reductase C-terminal domain-containing protein, partial [Geminicoccaceae bacterium]